MPRNNNPARRPEDSDCEFLKKLRVDDFTKSNDPGPARCLRGIRDGVFNILDSITVRGPSDLD